MGSKFEDWVTEDGLEMIKGWARDGMSDTQIAKTIRVHKTTFSGWQKTHPEIRQALKDGRAPFVEKVEDAAYKGATGYWVEETDTELSYRGDGDNRVESKRVIKHKRWIPPNAALVCYVLNNRKSLKWSNQPRPAVVEEAQSDGFLEAIKGSAAADWDGVTIDGTTEDD